MRSFREGDEGEIVEVLGRCHPRTWGTDPEARAHWIWKHSMRPGFRSSDVFVAEAGDRIVGCFHGAVLPLQLEPGLVVPMSFDGDFAVLPEYRGLNLTDRALARTDRQLLAEGVMLRGGFTTRELNEGFYKKRFGYVFVPSSSVEYYKPLGIGVIRQRVAEVGRRLLTDPAFARALDKPLLVDLNVAGWPGCHIEASRSGIRLGEGPATKPHLALRLPASLLAALSRGPRRFARVALLETFRGRVRASGLLRSSGRLLSLARALGRARWRRREQP